jgi:hypothetical protein
MFLKDSNNFIVDKANTLTTARTINGTSFNGSANITTAQWGTARNLQIGNTAKSVNGSANVTWSLNEIGAAASSHTHNYAGSSSAGGAANSANLLNMAGGRATSANSAVVVGPNTSMMLSTSSMTTGKPASDGYITEYRWDNNGGWSAQLFVPNKTTGAIQYRSMDAGTWGNWNTIYSTCNPQTTITGNAGTATKLQTARTINGTSFDGSANITTANWGTARNINGVSVNGSTNYTIPVENYYCSVNNDNTNLYHRILTTDIATTNYVDKSLIIVMHSGYQGGGFGIAKITLRTNDISSAANSQGEIKWLVRHGFAENALVFNLVNQAKNACMDVFYKSPGNYAGMTWYVLSEGGRGGNHSKQWTKYNTNASGTNAYTEANMKTLRTYASILVSAKDAGHVSTANSASTLSTARTINGTSFNGSANITTANWGTARNIQIGNTSKSVNGSGNVTWSLSEIGAAAASHGKHVPDTCTSITDWNAATTTGWYMGNNATNSPTANAWYFGEVIAHNTNYVVQTVYQFTASTDAKAIPKYIRAKMNGTWGAWTNVTVAKAVPSNAVFTDTNTWRGVQDNLTSTATDQSLSANQGKVLKGLIDGKAASSHNHGLLHDSFGVIIADTTTDNGWSMINGSYNGFLLKSLRSSASAPAWLQNNYSAGIAFGGSDTKGVMSVAYNAPSVRFAGGNGSKPVWYFTVTGNSGKTYNLETLTSNITSLQNELGTNKKTLEANINSIKGVL